MKLNDSQHQMFGNVITVGVLGMMSSLQLLEREEKNPLSYSLMLEVITAMDGMKIAFKNLVKGCGLPKKSEELVTEGLPLMTLVFVAQVIDPRLIMRFREVLLEGIGQLEASITGEAAFFIQQAKLALEEESFDDFQEAFNGAVKMMGANPEGLIKDLKQVEQFARTAWESLQSEKEMHAITGISQA